MDIALSKLKAILVDAGHISAADLDAAHEKSRISGKSVVEVLVEEGILSDAELGRIVAGSSGWQFVDVREEKIPPEMLRIIPEVAARSQYAIAFDQEGEKLKVAMADPANYELIRNLEKRTGYRVEVYFATPRAIEQTLRYYESDYQHGINELIESLSRNLDEGGTMKLVDLTLEYAYQSRASDIHFEPRRGDVRVRFRIDGILYEIAHYPPEIHERVVFRIKVLSRLRTDEHAAPQDGKFQYGKRGETFDIRVSVVPIAAGENVVLRLLAEHVRRYALDELGFSDKDAATIRRAMQKPYGMIFAAGPTGCGKTTTIYAMLQILNRPEVNIMTIEDPVEYEIEGVHQIQVNPKTNLTFASGLRSIVRQDPDIIFVGETRDEETANIAINAALTGHLLLSTIHANDSATVFPRLIDLAIEPFLVASSVNVVVAQRLIRKICTHCIRSYFLNDEEYALLVQQGELVSFLKAMSGKNDLREVRFYKGEGCKTCEGLGYLGRTGIFEVLEVTDSLKALMVKKAPSDEIRREATSLGMTTMIEDGILNVFRGITTLAEVVRATKT